MKTYNLTEAARLLGVDPATLRRWRRSAGGIGTRGPVDRRRVWLSRVELAALARAHGLVLLDTVSHGIEVAELARDVVALRERVVALENAVFAHEHTE